jgi:hypothetical protein
VLGQLVSLFDKLQNCEDANTKQAEKMMWLVPRHIQDETIKPPPMRIACMCCSCSWFPISSHCKLSFSSQLSQKAQADYKLITIDDPA